MIDTISFTYILVGTLEHKTSLFDGEDIFVRNLAYTITDFFCIMYDWIFFEQYITTGILMPAVANIFKDITENEKRKICAKRVILALRIIFYLIVLTWLIISIATGSVFIRRSNSVLYIVICMLYVWSLLKIKKYLKSLEDK